MRSRAARLAVSAVALIVLGAAGYFLFDTEQQIGRLRGALGSFDLRARETTTALADVRAAQQAYVATGQGVAFWMPKVESLLGEVAPRIDDLRGSAAGSGARSALMEAAASVTEFGNVDRRVRDYLRSGQMLMAGDIVFTEGGETAATAARQVESARIAEHQTFDATEAGLRRRQAAAMGGAAAFGAFVLLALALASPRPREETAAGIGESADIAAQAGGELMLRQPSPASHESAGQASGRPSDPSASVVATAGGFRGSAPMLMAAAELCTDFSRVAASTDLPRLLSRAADMMDASGLVVWLGDRAGGDLRPVLSHGYPDQVLARMPAIPRAADNAAAAAYRSGKLQIVLKRPGVSNGAVVAPLLAPEGCIGALTAEILAGSETSDSVQALASLIAAQLTGVLAGSVSASDSTIATQGVVSR